MVLKSIHNLCFGAKIRKIGIPLHTRPVNSPGHPVILTVLPWTNNLPSDFYKKRQTNGFQAVYRLILTSETKKKTYPGFSVFTLYDFHGHCKFPVEFGNFRSFRFLFLAYSAIYVRIRDSPVLRSIYKHDIRKFQ